MPGDAWQQFANLRAAARLHVGAPGQEAAVHGRRVRPAARVDARGRARVVRAASTRSHAGVQRWVRRPQPRLPQRAGAARARLHAPTASSGSTPTTPQRSVLAFLRKPRDRRRRLLVVCNFTPVPRDNYRVGVPHAGRWRELPQQRRAATTAAAGCGNLGGVRSRRRCRRTAACHSLSLTLPPLAHCSCSCVLTGADDSRSPRSSIAARADGRVRAVIDAVPPCVDGGRFAVKRVVGDDVAVEADCFADGHDVRARACCCGAPTATRRWQRGADGAARQRPLARQLHGAARSGRYRYTVAAWVDALRVVAPRARAPRRRRRHPPRRARRRRADRRGRRSARAAATRRALAALGRAAARRRAPTTACRRRGAEGAGARRGAGARIAAALSRPAPAVALPAPSCRWSPTASARASAPGTSSFRARPSPRAGRARHASATCEARLPYVAEHGLRRAVLPADPSDRPRAAQGPEQHARRRARRRRQPVGDRRRRGRPQGHPARARHARGLPARWSREAARPRHRDRARHRVPVRARPPLREGAPGVVPPAARRHACSTPRTRRRSTRTSTRSTSRREDWRGAVGRAQERVRPLDRAGRDDLPRRQPAHQAVRVLGMGDRARSSARIRT